MNYNQFLIPEDAKLNLKKHKTDFSGDYTDKNEAKEDLVKNVKRLTELQDVLYADMMQPPGEDIVRAHKECEMLLGVR